MREVAVRRLVLRVPPGQAAAGRQRAEDALHLATPDETRLVLLRKLDLGVLPVRAGAADWLARAEERLAERRARAVHGASPGAEAADAVWFHSAEEARRLLLLLLATGREPMAWFWRLAVPEWRGLGLPAWLGTWVAAASRDPVAELALARAVVAAAEAGVAPTILAALARVDLPAPVPPGAEAAAAAALEPAAETAMTARRLLFRLPAAMPPVLRQAIAPSTHAAAAAWSLRLALVAVAPELAGQPALLAPLVDAAAETLRPRTSTDFPAARPVPPRGTPRDGAPAPPSQRGPAERGAAQAHTMPGAPDAEAAPPSTAARISAPPGTLDATPPTIPHPPLPQAQPSAEFFSRGAGVLLTIGALERLGLAAWLANRPALAAAGFGRHLLRHIATRARLAEDDPLFALLPAPDPTPDAVLLQTWRIGLDRWLRRRCRLKLAALAGRPGWLHAADDVLQARFRVAAADLRLRRAALDADPLWVSWLGLVVRYHYRDEPLA